MFDAMAVADRESPVSGGAAERRRASEISVVIPAFNEESTIETVLSGLSAQTTLPREVVLVDAGSSDETVRRAERFPAPFELTIVRKGRLHPGEARNEGARHARCDWIAFLDAGTMPAPNWLERLATRVAETDADVVFGSYAPLCDTFFRRCAAIAYVPARTPDKGRGPAAISMAIHRRVFEDLGGFPPFRASEDLIFFEKVFAGPLRVAYAPDAEVSWQTAPDAISTFRRFAAYSKANLLAGRARYWHRGIARQYVVVGGIILACLAAGWGVWSAGVIPPWLLARSARSGWRKRSSLPFPTISPRHLVGASFLLVLIDAATLAGWFGWLTERSPSGS